MGTMVFPPKTMLEVYEYLPEGTLCQLINNQIIMSPSPLDVHQKVLGLIYVSLVRLVDENGAGEVRLSPYDVHINERNVFHPDIIFISNSNLHKIKSNGFYGAPDLVIELLSPSTSKYDLQDKKDVYEQHGVKEYWIVDPSQKTARGYILAENKFTPLPVSREVLHSVLLNGDLHF